ncbi:MAG: DNA cytosine methyltransferase [Bacteroidaceae bacterium]|nr:DNA cytosine methyltransferase [Bacteroidaceae bacterium]
MRVVDLFCGCGGLSLGFEKAGMEVVAGFDNWQDALTVYRNNFSHPALHADLMDVEGSVEKIRTFAPDMIIGGPPCQDFSSAGKRDENNGRGDLTVCYARIIASIRPQWFVMENVERITKTQKLQDALAIFHEAGYGTSYTVLNAALCGVPQRRKRFVMIGRLGAENDFMQTTIRENLADHEMSVAEYFGDKLDIKYYYRHPRSYVRRGIFSTDEPSATIRGVNRPMPKGYNLHPGDPVNSLEGVRPLTTRERSMIQTFPEDFSFDGTKTNIEQMIGNAVPVNLGYFVADAIFRYSGEARHEYKAKRPSTKQLSFLDMLDLFEGVNTEATMVCEDAPQYGRYRAPMYPTEFHEKLYIARGNVFDVESFWADGVAAFVKGGFNNISASYDEFKSTPHEGVHVAEYLYNNPGTTDPTPENVNNLVADALNSLVEKGAKVITMPPINIVGVKAEVKDALTAQAVVAWLKENGEKINRLIIVDKEGAL